MKQYCNEFCTVVVRPYLVVVSLVLQRFERIKIKRKLKTQIFFIASHFIGRYERREKDTKKENIKEHKRT